MSRSPAPSPPPRESLRFLLIAAAALAIVAAVFIAFSPALNAEFVDYDDTDNFLRNFEYRGLGAQQLAWMWDPRTPFFMGHYHPLTWMTLGLDYELYEMEPQGYHFTNLLLHAFNSVLVFFIAIRLLSRPRGLEAGGFISSGQGVMIAAMVALLWALHPLRVESVAWITERRDLVNAFFALLAVLAYLKMTTATVWRSTWLAACYFLFLASLLGKVMTVTLPAVLLVMDFFPLRRLSLDGSLASRRSLLVLVEKIPFFLTTAFFIWFGARGQAAGGWLLSWEQHGLLPRLAVSCHGFVFYLKQTLLPLPGALLPMYEIHLPIDPSEPRFIIAAAIIGALGAALALIGRRGAGIAAAFACYGIILSPVIGILQNGLQIAADRYAYLAALPLMILIGAGLRRVPTKWSLPLALLVATALGALTMQQTRVWQSTASLWKHVAMNDPNSSQGQNSYGFVLLNEKKVDEAIARFNRAIEILPSNYRAHVNLWTALERKGDMAAVEAAARSALDEPVVAPYAHYKLGNLKLMAPSPDAAARRQFAAEAKAHLEASLAIREENAEAHTNLAIALTRLDQPAEAERHFRRAIEIKPRLANPRHGLALLLIQQNRHSEAIAELEALLKVDPNHAAAREALTKLQ